VLADAMATADKIEAALKEGGQASAIKLLPACRQRRGWTQNWPSA